jgi:anti-sigma regulatory factor (Ser/Thr protein kinase)
MPIIARREFSVTYQLGSEPQEVARCREQVRKVIPRWGLGEHVDAAELIVGELVTNAQRHSYCGVQVHLSYDGNYLRMEVWDSSICMPVIQQPALDDEVGRGLQIVDGLAKEYGGKRGIVDLGTRAGKTVYVTLPIRYAYRCPKTLWRGPMKSLPADTQATSSSPSACGTGCGWRSS